VSEQEAQILPAAGAKPKVRGRGYLAREVIETISLAVCIFLAIHFSVQPYRVSGPSMQPGVRSDEIVLVNLLAYHFGSPQRGDVVVFHPPFTTDQHLQLIKRVIAIPGDTVTITATAIYVNGKKLSEPYLTPLPSDGVETVTGIVSDLKLGKDQYWVMGDNRRDSLDSRSFGTISGASIVGKAEVIVWPFNALQWLPTYSSVFKT